MVCRMRRMISDEKTACVFVDYVRPAKVSGIIRPTTQQTHILIPYR